MKTIKLTEEQKSRLLEMCKVLFPKYLSIEYWDFDSYSDHCGIGGDEQIENCLCFYPQKLPLNKENPPTIDWENVQIDNIPITIHWFEFCMTHLVTKLRSYNPVHEQTPKQLMDFYSFYWDVSNYQMTQTHPIDYLYEQFKKLKH